MGQNERELKTQKIGKISHVVSCTSTYLSGPFKTEIYPRPCPVLYFFALLPRLHAPHTTSTTGSLPCPSGLQLTLPDSTTKKKLQDRTTYHDTKTKPLNNKTGPKKVPQNHTSLFTYALHANHLSKSYFSAF